MTAPAERTAGTARRDDRSGPWFDALADDTLLIRHCPRCGHHSRPDAAACPACHAVVELDEGPWLAVRLIADPPPAPGSRVILQILKAGQGEPIPGFAVVP